MERDLLVKLSKFMSLILRHEPEKFGLMLDEEGFTTLDDLLPTIRVHGSEFRDIGLEEVLDVVNMDPAKKRFRVEGKFIRANYGHSATRPNYAEGQPPIELFHGTNVGAVSRILKEGLKPMGRSYVHLTGNKNLALMVGARHGQPRLVKIHAQKAVREGVKFYNPNDTFWLADHVPPKFLLVQL